MRQIHCNRAITFILLALVPCEQLLAQAQVLPKAKCVFANIMSIKPKEHAKVPAGSKFSFVMTPNTLIETLSVTMKDQVVPFEFKRRGDGFYVIEGVIPATLPEGFVRIKVFADSLERCAKHFGWLVELTGPAAELTNDSDAAARDAAASEKAAAEETADGDAPEAEDASAAEEAPEAGR